MIDLSIPHNVEKNVTENKNVTLIDVDELSKQIQETIQQREKEIPKAEKIIKELMKDFIEWEKKKTGTQHSSFQSSIKEHGTQ